ncbi:hypothetical protein PBT90_06420 [Algoriphagus halophytocola]|uniref:hypothetical protein n=1 Tax=Algoriphagus halophytocola TaxID=2991499 RepID=UPI0022DD4D12|nr:hypothetical protein [Algoriphagus sp. TR-M9]WBL44318.1 hypothetical protein PBT90_06420 [Algoriphagus sp. TR-M9]
MRFILFVFLTALIVLLSNPFIPYWGVMVVVFVAAVLVGQKGAGAFFAGGLGMGLAWLGYSYYIGITTGSDLPNHMAGIMGLAGELYLFAATGILGFILGAFSAWSGSLFRKLLKKQPDNIYRG